VGPGSFWAGKFSHSETYPAHNERGGSPTPSMTRTSAPPAKQASRSPELLGVLQLGQADAGGAGREEALVGVGGKHLGVERVVGRDREADRHAERDAVV
jgi:hypothetical protein